MEIGESKGKKIKEAHKSTITLWLWKSDQIGLVEIVGMRTDYVFRLFDGDDFKSLKEYKTYFDIIFIINFGFTLY